VGLNQRRSDTWHYLFVGWNREPSIVTIGNKKNCATYKGGGGAKNNDHFC
jgi:hypothetical protein